MSDDHARDLQTAVAEFQLGPLHARAEARVTPAGILAIGAMVSGVLLSAAVVVWASTSVARERVGRHHQP